MQAATLHFPFYQYWFCVLGIVISIILPILRQLLPKPIVTTTGFSAWKRYVAAGVFSLLTAVILVAFGKDSVSGWFWYDALLVGYAWDSTLQKVING